MQKQTTKRLVVLNEKEPQSGIPDILMEIVEDMKLKTLMGQTTKDGEVYELNGKFYMNFRDWQAEWDEDPTVKSSWWDLVDGAKQMILRLIEQDGYVYHSDPYYESREYREGDTACSCGRFKVCRFAVRFRRIK